MTALSTRPRPYVLAWLFVVAVTGFDIYWALVYRETAENWESNPVMRWVIASQGVTAAAALRAGTVLFAAALMPLASGRCRLTATGITTAAHIYLAVAYALIIWGPVGTPVL